MFPRTQNVMTTNREKRSFWQFVLAMGLIFLVSPLFGDRPLANIDYAGAVLTVVALARLWNLKGQRRMAVAGGNGDRPAQYSSRSDLFE